MVLWSCPAYANQGTGSSAGSILNILLLGLVAYFLVRAFRRRSGGKDETRPGSGTPNSPEDSQKRTARPVDRHEAARQMWDVLSSEPQVKTDIPSVPVAPDGFDETEFLEGAKLFFSRFQQVADSGELDDLRPFLSNDVYREALDGVESGVGQERVEIMLLEARLMEMKSEGGQTFASVFYDAQLRKGASGEQAEHLRTVWEFSRDDSAANGLWTLEKINKMNQ